MNSPGNKKELMRGEFVLQGKPTPWARASPGYNRRLFDTQKALKLTHGITIQSQRVDDRWYNGPVNVDFVFFVETKQSHRWGKYCWTVPDLDNLEKYILDMIKSLLYKDDCQVAKVTKMKIWAKEGRTEFIISELPPYPNSKV